MTSSWLRTTCLTMPSSLMRSCEVFAHVWNCAIGAKIDHRNGVTSQRTLQLAGNRSLDGFPAHFLASSAGFVRCRRHETGPSTTFGPGPSTIPRISRKPQAVYLRFHFYDRRRGRWVPPKRSRWAASVARGPRGRPGGRRGGGRRRGRRPRGAPPRAGSGIVAPSLSSPSRIIAPRR